MDGAVHGSVDGGEEGMTGIWLGFDFQIEPALPDVDFSVLKFCDPGTQIGGDAVFFSLQVHKPDDPGKLRRPHWDLGNGQHDTAPGDKCLCPERLRRFPFL